MAQSTKSDLNLDKIVSLAKRRGFVFQSSEIYGGLNGCWDYGPLGVELLRNVKDEWWKKMTLQENIEGIDASILMHPKVWEASGHVENFTDPMVDCKECKARFRADQLEDVMCPRNPNRPAIRCQQEGKFTEARQFNLMFKTFIGPVEDSSAVVYLRPETAQGIYVNYQNVIASSRQKLPFGIVQIGKAFRNEINTKNWLFRTREFEQMEMQFFVKPGTDDEWFERWRQERMQWFLDLGIRKEKLQFQRHEKHKLAHYAKDAYDIEYEFPFGWGEIEGIHNRTNFDLTRHQQYSGKSMEYFDDATKEKYIPYIIETSAGASRSFMTILVDAYAEEDTGKEIRTVLKLHPRLAPVKVAILPLVNRENMPDIARNIFNDVRKDFRAFYDDAGSIGRRYRRQDEAGTPYCVTIDSQTLQDQTVTVRERDSMQQERVSSSGILKYLQEKLKR
ncbi:MAG: glycine--tRNA ligase [Bacteroidetes bacterium]|nr:glycine--tRNA ligase [Bacteroidota bacterium]MCL5737034.1 glycine--tRNA ligase [Bacteroidota bacterium]